MPPPLSLTLGSYFDVVFHAAGRWVDFNLPAVVFIEFPVRVRLWIGAWLEIVGEQLDVIRAGDKTFGIPKRSDAVAAVSLSFS
jgi:hypothetical protein